MKPEPLKDKNYYAEDYTTNISIKRNLPIYQRKDIKSAIEWLKDKLKKNQLSNLDYNYVCNDIDKAFEDVLKK